MAIQGLYKIFDHWHKNGAVWIISDLHFGDKELECAVPGRPTAEQMVKLINSKVGKYDTLICLGDVINVDYVRQLKGYKVLIMGNHDSGRTNYERQIITQQFFKNQYTKQQVLNLIKTLFPNYKYSIDENDEIVWKIIADNMLFDEVYEGPLMISEKLILSHEPIDVSWAFNIHGHIHDSKHKNNKRHFNVCSDTIGYVPINMNQWMKQGYLSHIESIHRTTIDKATERKKKRDGRSFNSYGQKR